MLARPTRSTPILDLVSTSEVITAIAVFPLEMDRTHPLVPAHEISPGAGSCHLTSVRWSLRWLQGN